MLLEHYKPFNFDKNYLKAFVVLKKALVTVPATAVPDLSIPFELMHNASGHSVRVVLGQRKYKFFHSIYYANKALANA